jgi:hypothetical protein
VDFSVEVAPLKKAGLPPFHYVYIMFSHHLPNKIEVFAGGKLTLSLNLAGNNDSMEFLKKTTTARWWAKH